MKKNIALALWMSVCTLSAAQVMAQSLEPAPAVTGVAVSQGSAPAVSHPGRATADQEYRVGPGDVLSVAVLQLPELKSSVRVSEGGAVSLPMLGMVQASGLTLEEIERSLADRLRRSYVRDPHVTVQVVEIASHPVSVVGAVVAPGVFQVRGPMKLLEVLSLAKGVNEAAGNHVLIVRGPDATLPATAASPAESTTTQIDLKRLFESDDPSLNVVVRPGDVVKVPGAPIVYVVGEVKKPGAFPVPRGDRLTVLRALALGEGMTPLAAKGDAVIIRVSEQGSQTEIAVHIDRIIKAEQPDVMLQANDVLFIPGSGGKVAAIATFNALSRFFVFRPF